MIIINLTLATICFLGQCHPILVGPQTPTGEYTLTKRYTEQKGYGGDVLQFHEDDKYVYAIHLVWKEIPKQQREQRLRSDNIKDRYITSGCINVDSPIYDKLLQCCSNASIIIKR